MPQIWMIGPRRHWHVRPVPERARGLPLIEQLLCLSGVRREDDLDWLSGEFWLVFDQEESVHLAQAGTLLRRHLPAQALLEAAVAHVMGGRNGGMEAWVISTNGPDARPGDDPPRSHRDAVRFLPKPF